MRIELRKSYPFYGKFSYRVSIRCHDQYKKDYATLQKYLKDNYKSEIDFKCSDSWRVYLKNKTIYDDILTNFKGMIIYTSIPAPGYEHLTGRAPKIERGLWYKKFPYKITIRDPDREGDYKFSFWCEDNINY